MKKQSQSGIAVVELVVAVVLVAAVIGVGLYVWHSHNKNSSSTTSSVYHSPTTSTPPAPQINNASDLNSALSALNQTSVNSSNVDSSQLSTYSSGF
ncbi:MAG: hypothetical protein ACYCPS_01290 [Candidatus Saccharimonadales bacterium]